MSACTLAFPASATATCKCPHVFSCVRAQCHNKTTINNIITFLIAALCHDFLGVMISIGGHCKSICRTIAQRPTNIDAELPTPHDYTCNVPWVEMHLKAAVFGCPADAVAKSLQLQLVGAGDVGARRAHEHGCLLALPNAHRDMLARAWPTDCWPTSVRWPPSHGSNSDRVWRCACT
jgi:hypothetical protein